MSMLATTKMSSKGQVVIPEQIRSQLGLEVGAQFVVMGNKDVVIFKSISMPSLDHFENLISKVRKQAKKANIQREDISFAIKKVRPHQ